MEIIVRDQVRRSQFWWPREFEQTMKLPRIKNSRRRRLFCRNGFYLRVTADKRVSGTTNPFDPSVVFDLVPTGDNGVNILNVKTGFYVAIDQNGDIMAKSSPDVECVFQESITNNFYDIFKRPRTSGPPFVIGLRKNGDAESTLYRGKKQAKFCEFCFVSQLIYIHSMGKTRSIVEKISSLDQTDNVLDRSTTKHTITLVTHEKPVPTRKLRAADYYAQKQ